MFSEGYGLSNLMLLDGGKTSLVRGKAGKAEQQKYQMRSDEVQALEFPSWNNDL
jgi:hypothetical protein